MPKGEYTRTEAGRRAYFVVTGVELPDTLTHDAGRTHQNAFASKSFDR